MTVYLGAVGPVPDLLAGIGVFAAGIGLLLAVITALLRLAWRHTHECDGCGHMVDQFGPWGRVHRALIVSGWQVEHDGARLLCPKCCKVPAQV